MNIILKSVITFFPLIFSTTILIAQAYTYDSSRLSLRKIEPYKLAVTYDKTTHLIFPAKVRYVDLGSGYIIAGKAEGIENVLRVKAAIDGFNVNTNFSVITDDGRFYNFNVNYDSAPLTLNYDLINLEHVAKNTNAFFHELGTTSPESADSMLAEVYHQNIKNKYHVKSKSYGIRFALKGIYIKDNKLYFHTELKNESNIPFLVAFMHFKIADKKTTKRTVRQQQLITPIRTYQPMVEINGQSIMRNVFLLNQFTLADGKVLLIQVFEKNGGRHQVLKVKNTDLIKARLIGDLKK